MAAPADSSQRMKVLHVDDEEDLRDLVAEWFSEAGFDVVSASSGNEAFKILQEDPQIQLVVSDCVMPDGTGEELLEKIQGMPHGRPKVILTTGYSKLSPQEAYALGAAGYFSKPYRFETMLARVEEIFSDEEQSLSSLSVEEFDKSKGIVVQVCEDDEAAQQLFERALQLNKLDQLTKLSFFKDGESLLEALFPKEGNSVPHVDVIVLDLRLPGMSGFDVLKRVRQNPIFEDVPILILTGSRSERDRDRAYSLGASFYYTKPDGFDGWAHLVRSLGQSWIVKLRNRFDELEATKGKD